MSAMSDYLENALFNVTLRATSFTAPAAVYLALYTAAPADAGGGTEVSGGGYARQAVTFSAPSNGSASNSADVTYSQATASWGTVTHWGLLDASTAGNLLYHGALTASKTIDSGDQFKVSAGNLTITLA